MLLDPACAPSPPPGFLQFQLKDLITATIASAAFLTAATNVWVAYLRQPKLKTDLAESLRMGYGPETKGHHLVLMVDVFAINSGARPGIITRMALEIYETNEPKKKIRLNWTEFLKSENIAPKGEPRKVHTDFAGFAAPVPVPKYDARLIEAGFAANATWNLVANRDYSMRLIYWMAGHAKERYGKVKEFKLDDRTVGILEKEATTAPGGIRPGHVFLAAADGRHYTSQNRTT